MLGGATAWVLAALSGPVLLAGGNLYRTLRWSAGAEADGLAAVMLAAAATQLLAFGLLAGLSLEGPPATGATLPSRGRLSCLRHNS